MSEGPGVRAWDGGGAGWTAADQAEVESAGALLVADSWLLAEGRVRGWDLHMDRFAGSCLEAGAGPADLESPLDALPAEMPAEGEWFPRVEMRPGPRLYLRLRPSPPRWEEAAVWPSRDDPRRSPTTKGPDIERLMALRAEAREHGADEATIVDDRDEVIEAAGCSVVWWEEGALAMVPAGERILDGITRRLLTQIAERHEVEVRESSLPLAGAAGREVWLVNALIGIAPVTRWVGLGDGVPADRDRLATWRGRLDELALAVA